MKIGCETEKWFNRVTEGVTWEIKQYGSKKKQQKRLSEQEMVSTFNDHCGILMAGYWHAGSGWWRARPLQVNDAGSIIIGEYEEMMNLYNDEKIASLKACDLEEMSTQELEDTNALQKNAIYNSHPLNKSIQQNELKKALNI